MDGSKIITLNEVIQTEEGNYYMMLLICGSLKKEHIQINLFTKQK